MLDIFLIVIGLLFLIASMVFILNPPEAWVKRAFQKPRKPRNSAQKDRESSSEADRIQ